MRPCTKRASPNDVFTRVRVAGHVHAMYSATWQQNGLPVTISSQPAALSANLSASAQQSDDGKTLVVRLANVGNTSVTMRLNISGGSISRDATVWLLSSPSGDQLDANTPAEPTRVSPVRRVVSAAADIVLPAVSAAVVEMKR